MQTETPQWVIDYIREHGEAFYLLTVWKHKRKEILVKYHNECQRCKREHKLTRATMVHHKKHLKEFPELALADDNLEPLCDSCHNIEHPEKLRKFHKVNKWNDERW